MNLLFVWMCSMETTMWGWVFRVAYSWKFMLCRILTDLLWTLQLNHPGGEKKILVLLGSVLNLMFVLFSMQLPQYVLDSHLGTLTSKTKKSIIDFSPVVSPSIFFPVNWPSYRIYSLKEWIDSATVIGASCFCFWIC